MKAICLLTTLIAAISLASCSSHAHPLSTYQLPWADTLPWKNTQIVPAEPWATLQERINQAQQTLSAQGGGVIQLEAGIYRLHEDLVLRDGIILRGVPPKKEKRAKMDAYRLETMLLFPRYQPLLEGNGTPNHTAFKCIRLHNPLQDSNCGLLDIHIENGHINMGDLPVLDSLPEGVAPSSLSKNRFVVGCIVRNAAKISPNVPDATFQQYPWQRFTDGHTPAIRVDSWQNALVANNRIPQSGEANFEMRSYEVKGRGKHSNQFVELPLEENQIPVLFDYDNRPGILVNHCGIGGGGASDPNGTPDSHPHGFRPGIIIRDNFVYCSGRTAIGFTGDGVICSFNTIRFPPNLSLWTHTGLHMVWGTSTNDNRAVEMRGWRWTVEGNDYEVHSNIVAGSPKYRVNDGEGLMHEDHVNSTVLDSQLINNKGNKYISIYKTAGIDGLLIQGNEVPAIMAVADRNSGRYFIRNVLVDNNRTDGINLGGSPSDNIVVRNNSRITLPNEKPGYFIATCKITEENNIGFLIAWDEIEADANALKKRLSIPTPSPSQ